MAVTAGTGTGISPCWQRTWLFLSVSAEINDLIWLDIVEADSGSRNVDD